MPRLIQGVERIASSLHLSTDALAVVTTETPQTTDLVHPDPASRGGSGPSAVGRSGGRTASG